MTNPLPTLTLSLRRPVVGGEGRKTMQELNEAEIAVVSGGGPVLAVIRGALGIPRAIYNAGYAVGEWLAGAVS